MKRPIVYRISSRARYDHFDTSPYLVIRCRDSFIILTQFFANGKPLFQKIFLKKVLDISCRIPYNSHRHGGVAQLGERLTGSQEVMGSIPTVSTKDRPLIHSDQRFFFSLRKIGIKKFTPSSLRRTAFFSFQRLRSMKSLGLRSNSRLKALRKLE